MNLFSSVFGFQFSAVYYDVPKCDFFVFSQLGAQWPWIWRLTVCISLGKSVANTLQIFFLSYSLLLQVSDHLRVRPFHCISYIFYPLFCCWFFFSFVCASVEHFLLTCLSVTKFCSFVPNQPLNPFNGLLTSDSRLFNSKIFILFFLNRFLSSKIFFYFPECSNHSYFKALICYFQCLGYL